MITFFTILSTLGISLLIFLALFSFWFILKPYLLFEFYKEQGAKGYFKPFGAFFHDRMREARINGDFMRYFKDTIHKFPDVKVIASNVGSQAMLYLIDPDMIKEFVNQPQLYKKADFISGVEGLFEGQGILFSEGEKWKKQRKILTAAFHSDLMKEQVPMMAKAAEEVYSSIRTKSKDLGHVNIMKANQKVAGDIIGRFFFGKSYSEYKFEGHSITIGLRKLLKDGFRQMYTIWNAVFGAWFIRAGILPKHRELMDRIENFRATMKDIITEIKKKNKYLEDEPEKTLIQTLIQQQKQNPEAAMTDEEIVDNFISLFLAGTDPTGNLASMVLYFLTQNPEVYQKLQSEINKNISKESDISFEDIHKLDYTQAVIKETLRKANPQGILVFREATEDHKLRNLHIRKGTLVTFSPILNGYNEKYCPSYVEFCPERWIPGEDKAKEMKGSPFACLPFSAGPRTCLGNHLAMMEVKVMLANLLKKFEVDMSSDYTLKMTNRGTYEPLENMKVSLTSRESSM